jgi:DNA-binding response OmpR family regulator
VADSPRRPAGAGGGGRILLADDEETFRCATAELLRRRGYACDDAPDGGTAAALLAERRHDLLIVDIRMQGNRDLELIAGLRRAGDPIPVVIVTGYPSLVTAIKAVDLRVSAYLVKPVDFEDLLERVRLALAGGAPFLPARVTA